MLPPSSKTEIKSTLSPVEGVSPLQKYSSELESPSPFPSIEKDDSEKEREDSSSSQHTETDITGDNTPDLSDLFPQYNFQEILDRFFIDEHEELLSLRTKIRRERGIDENSLLITLAEINAREMQALREQYYQLQMVFYHTPKGEKYETMR